MMHRRPPARRYPPIAIAAYAVMAGTVAFSITTRSGQQGATAAPTPRVEASRTAPDASGEATGGPLRGYQDAGRWVAPKRSAVVHSAQEERRAVPQGGKSEPEKPKAKPKREEKKAGKHAEKKRPKAEEPKRSRAEASPQADPPVRSLIQEAVPGADALPDALIPFSAWLGEAAVAPPEIRQTGPAAYELDAVISSDVAVRAEVELPASGPASVEVTPIDPATADPLAEPVCRSVANPDDVSAAAIGAVVVVVTQRDATNEDADAGSTTITNESP